ncbi:hypothetical protein DAI22_02g036601 [Oryza sativa Japonica Group]|nr:uncharacterized protein LOC112937973 [Oryza sativa Japonica Group]KAF2943036.1 hypothetical protein DAI22_02g036601 [Oryza sativa Japonica Group]
MRKAARLARVLAAAVSAPAGRRSIVAPVQEFFRPWLGWSSSSSAVRALPPQFAFSTTVPHLPPRSVAPATSAAIVPTVRSSPPSRSAGSPWTGRTASRWFGTGASSTAATPPSLHTMKTGETSSPTSPIESLRLTMQFHRRLPLLRPYSTRCQIAFLRQLLRRIQPLICTRWIQQYSIGINIL